MLNLESNLYSTLIFAKENEGILRAVKSERMSEYRELERMGLIELNQKATGMAIVHLTDDGKEHLDSQ
ncbi:hypothetical protein [Paenibacillus xylanexedens]|uniref:hypothetical protein n=1 Tax=Paenibacillus xylanexedens TaxID=528191 RepID=UPI00119D6B07|nr:hypothetical protein [Paenibacillus xylanexedens]